LAVPRAKTELENVIQYGVDLFNRTLHFGQPLDREDEDGDSLNDFTQASVETAVRGIHLMQSDHPKKPITIYMNSFGGDSIAMLYLKDVILASTCQFKFYGGGAICSSASWILAVCDERYLYADTKVMVHNGSESLRDKYDDFHINAAESKRSNDRLLELYAENSRMPIDFWKKICKRDMWFSAAETVYIGLAEKIVPCPKRGNLRKMRNKNLSQLIDKKDMRNFINKMYRRIDLDTGLKELHLPHPRLDEADPEVTVDDSPIPTPNDKK